LKPGNIFLDEHFNVKIGDFGLATSIGELNAQLEQKFSENRPRSLAGAILHSSFTIAVSDLESIFLLIVIPFRADFDRKGELSAEERRQWQRQVRRP